MSLQAMDWALRTVQGITPTQKLILICLANHAGPEGTCWPSQNILSAYSGLSRETIYRNLSDLEKQGLIRSIPRQDQSGRDLSKTYVLNITKEEGSRRESSSGETQSLRGETQSLTGGAKMTGGRDAESHPIKSRLSEQVGETQSLTGETESLREGDAESQGGETQSLTSKENQSREESVNRTKRLKTPPTPKTPASQNPALGGASERGEKSPTSGTISTPKEAESKPAQGDGSPSRQEAPPEDMPLPPWLDPNDWRDFLNHREEIKAPMSALAKKRALAELDRLRKEGHEPGQVIGGSIVNGWKGLFPVRASGVPAGRQPPKTFDEIRAERTQSAAKQVLDDIYGPKIPEAQNGTITL